MKRRALLQAAPALALAPWLCRPRPGLSRKADPLHRARWRPAAAATWSAAPSPNAGRSALGADLRRGQPERRRRRGRLPGHDARAAPDGYTLMLGYVATHGTNPAVRKLPYDAVKDFTPIAMVGGTPNVLVVDADLPVKTLQEFVAYAEGQPGQGQLRLRRARHADPPGDGAVQGRAPVPSWCTSPLPRHRARPSPTCWAARRRRCSRAWRRRCRTSRGARCAPLAVTGKHASPLLPDVPDPRGTRLQGLRRACSGTASSARPACRADRGQRSTEINRSLCQAPDLREKLSGEALEPMPMTPEQFGEYIRHDIASWTKVASSMARQPSQPSTNRRPPWHATPRSPPTTTRRPSPHILAEFVANHPSRGWSDAVEHEAHRTFLNWLGCAIGAARHEAARGRAGGGAASSQPAPQATRAGPRRAGRHGQRRAAQRHHARTPSTSTTRT